MKKLIVLLLAGILAFGSVACSQGATPGDTTEGEVATNGNQATNLSGSTNGDLYLTGDSSVVGDGYEISYTTDSPNVTIDFGNKDGSKSQNVKKIDMFSPTWDWTKSEGLNRESLDTTKYLSQLKSENLRMDLFFGGGGLGANEIIESGVVTTQKAWNRILNLSEAYYKNNVTPMFIYVGIPAYWQTGTNISNPQESYYDGFCKAAAKTAKTLTYQDGRRFRQLYETWNEPDLDNTSYWSSGISAFLTVNTRMACSFKAGDPDAFVIETGLCYPKATFGGYSWNQFSTTNWTPGYNSTNWQNFIGYTKETSNHMDAFSWHWYGDDHGNMQNNNNEGNWDSWKTYMRGLVNNSMDTGFYDFHTTPFYISEFSTTATIGSYTTLSQVSYIPKIYSCFDEILEATDMPRFSWAALLMGSFSAIDFYTWRKYPLYYAWWSNGRLPLASATVSGSYSGFNVRSGVDDHRACAVIVNNTVDDTKYDGYASEGYNSQNRYSDIKVRVKNIPFTAKTAKIYLVDAMHLSYNSDDENPYLIMDLPSNQIKAGEMTFKFKIPENAAFHIEFGDGSVDESGETLSELDGTSNLYRRIVRKDHYIDRFADNYPYADIQESSFTASLGMLNNSTGKSAVMMTLDDMKDFNNLVLKYSAYDVGSLGANAAIGVRIDYQTATGSNSFGTYSSPIYYTYGSTGKGCFSYKFAQNSSVGYCWGTGAAATYAGSFGSGDGGTFSIPLKSKAPSGWTGRIQVTFYIMDAGSNASATIQAYGA